MKRLKSTLATILLVSAGAAAIGLGTIMAVAALVIGLVIAAAARLAIGAESGQNSAAPVGTDIEDASPVPAG